MSTLKSTIESLASQFALSVMNALKSAPMDEVSSYTGSSASAPRAAATSAPAASGRRPGRPKKTASASSAPAAAPKKRGRPAGSGSKKTSEGGNGGGRLSRRSAEDIGAVVESIVSLLGQNPDGLRAEQIRESLGLQAKELPRPLAEALSAGSISKQGQKRATTYFAAKGKKRK